MMGGAGARDLIFYSLFSLHVVQWKEKAFDVGGPSSIDFIYFGGLNEKQRSCDGWAGGGGAQRPVLRGNELKKTGARSVRARTRGQNPLILKYSASVFWSRYAPCPAHRSFGASLFRENPQNIPVWEKICESVPASLSSTMHVQVAL